ncbi:hypothetical protein PMAYCL1PPCAC_22784 [Pristionchus mayeri]|uniref:Uncharacterized protein n=1 Tax=Pristionchus mayeri TaxID=1317129 RepID=A0AAN5I5U1_9BILA|nr:hypothetical protein PMAYCL1PPCAC_22784 [Pristionchus mayeri]
MSTNLTPDPEWASMRFEARLKSAASAADYSETAAELLLHNASIPNKPYYMQPKARTNTSVAVTIVVSVTVGSTVDDYQTALDSVKCYSALHGYNLSIEFDNKFHECAIHKDKFFRRHCHVHMLMKTKITEGAWVLFIDGDVGIVNPNRLIEDYIEEGYEIYLYDRFYNWEYAAQYMVKNNKRGRAWVKEFASYEFKLPDSFHGTDNGALHPFMMHYLVPETRNPQTRSRCS